MKYKFYEEDLKELETIKSCGLGGRKPDDITQLGYSLYSYVRQMFPINAVPKAVEDSLNLLKERLKTAEDQWDLTLDVIISQVQQIKEKKCEKELPYATHVLHLRCNKCNALDFVFCKDAKDWKCNICSS